MMLTQCCTAGYYLSVHRDSLSLLRLLPLYSAYNGLILGSAWLIAAFDQLRGRAMRW